MIDIIFVDDEASVLEGLEHRLRPARGVWNMRFAVGGSEALIQLGVRPADVIVTDMRMPQMDGAELLRRVRDEYPRTIRLILTGSADGEGALKAMAVAHQFLTKPCEVDQLRSAVLRASALQDRLQSPAVIQAIGSLTSLPALPRLYWDLAREIDGEKANSASVCKILEQDVAMTARILQVVNSALFALSRRITSVQDAVTYLGFEPIRSLVLAVGLFRAMSSICSPAGFSLDRMQHHSMRVARVAMGLLKDPEDRKTAFSAAMLHDIGRLVLALSLPAEFARARAHSVENKVRLYESEQVIYGCTHAEVGAHMLALWGLPNTLVEAVAFHHTPAALPESRFGVAGAVHVADWLEHAAAAPSPVQAVQKDEDGLDRGYLGSVGVLNLLPDWRNAAQMRLAA